MLPQITRGRIADDIYQVLRRNILQQKLEAGQRLQVDDLADQLDVSRTPVREALNRLAAEELVEIVPRSGTYVAQPTAEDIDEIFDLRTALEGLAVEQVAAAAPNAEEVQALRDLLDWSSGPDEDEIIQHAEANRAFHERLVELTGNEKLMQIYRMLNAHATMALVHYSTAGGQERWDVEREEHEAILAALADGDPAAARRAMERHLERSRTSLIDDVERQETDPESAE
ncbi:MAG: GntR family transcriptional regulator [Salinibacter sp.]